MGTVKFSKTYKADNGKTFDSVTIRPPRHGEYLEIGEPMELQPNGQGGEMRVVYEDRISLYLDRLCSDPPHTSLDEIDLTDSIAMQEHLLDFFSAARKALYERMSSSSTSASPSTSSKG